MQTTPCNCFSTTHPNEAHTDMPVSATPPFEQSNANRPCDGTGRNFVGEDGTVLIDFCIYKAVKILWDNGFQTCASCCTHGEGTPTIHLERDMYGLSDIYRALELIQEVDQRMFCVAVHTPTSYLFRHTKNVKHGNS